MKKIFPKIIHPKYIISASDIPGEIYILKIFLAHHCEV
jgi:hypothetical protein